MELLIKHRMARIYFLLIMVVISLFSNILDKRFSTIIDYIILFFFSTDIIYFFKSVNKTNYLKEHFFDFLCLIPFHSGFRLLKIFSIVISLAEISSYKNIKVKKIIRDNIIFFTWFFLIIIILPLPMLWIEPNIRNYDDLIWWTIQTVTTVGYGDINIVSKFGRIVGMILMILGVSLISVLTSNIIKIMNID